MKDWFSSLTQRERTLVQLAGTVIILFIFYLIIIEPISSSYTKNKNNVASATETLEWMQAASVEIKQLRGGHELAERPKDKQFTLSLVDRSARKSGLAEVMKRVQPEGDLGVRVWFENAAFDQLITWLATIESEHGLSVNEINIEQTEMTGLVNVRVFLN
ncbi:MAG: type II secretion system protein M [Gammaproteobacteria bacterium]|nr:type II secretion system protein M [Gammaproteobacteria bacterium]MCW8988405.1 type II secretion system protein M [Gammaproteobacteria bacterium]MCW9029908.1 type II secretion system protein M [Gammaproteobacteria bacterium]